MTKSDVEVEEQYDANMSKGEIKARKAMAKLGLKSVPEINRVVIRKANNSLFIIAQADVYKTANGDTHVVFGESKEEDAAALERQMLDPNAQGAPAVVSAQDGDDEVPALEEADDGEEVDETGIEPNDIEMVMSQANVSRAKAVKALRANDNDIVNSIMELSVDN